MPLVLSPSEVRQALDLERCLHRLEEAYREAAAGRAAGRPRSHLYLPTSDPALLYRFKSLEGALPGPGFLALRLASDHLRWMPGPGGRREEKARAGAERIAFVLLFSTETGEWLAVMPDADLQEARMGLTNALAVRHLAREEARVVGLLGAGRQARAHARTLSLVRKPRRFRVYSPTPTSRRALCHDIEQELGIPAEEAADPAHVFRGADLVVTATNSVEACVRASWLGPGLHLSSINWPELHGDVFGRGDLVVVNSREAPVEICGPAARAHLPESLRQVPGWGGFPELAEVVSGQIPGRQRADEITFFINNVGLGIQFAAVAGEVYRVARDRGLGEDWEPGWLRPSGGG